MMESNYCSEYPICKCTMGECQYNTNRQGQIKQLVSDHYERLSNDRPNKKPKRKHATNYTPPKRRHRK